ncbi:hypothetical protein F5I97DRAFT_129284 [Phlebopus sp. FC_14]|nr:hypothetical protein F5I97DRAFT_129284 [Phlebopus sp. FC_14]
MRGYLAFPLPESYVSTNLGQLLDMHDTSQPPAASCTQGQPLPADKKDSDGTKQDSTGYIRQRGDQERESAERSEVEWVRAGGILRDALGRRDKARTERIWRELKLQEEEKQKMGKWDQYEERWRGVSRSAEPISFVDFPWPLHNRVLDRDLRAFTKESISDFLFESLSVRSNTTTRRDRIRNSLLRWHQDKISFVLNQVTPDDVEIVREGIHVVFCVLKGLQDAERTGPA